MNRFNLNNKICIVTGGSGLLGKMHAEAIIEANGTPILLDLNEKNNNDAKQYFKRKNIDIDIYNIDITKKNELIKCNELIINKYGKVDILINNAANNPKVKEKVDNLNHFENFLETVWENDLNVGLKGAFLCSQIFGNSMLKNKNGGVILNISSDLGVIAPDQRIYMKKNLLDNQQYKKPVTYSVIKHGLNGLTKYLATYWANKNIRVNTLSPGGVYNNHNSDFLKNYINLVPMNRMANKDEYKSAIIFLISDASSYMTGTNLIIDGGRACW